MAKNETGHSINAKNFSDLISIIESWGTEWNPPKDDLKLPFLKDLQAKISKEMSALSEAEGKATPAIRMRATLADKMDKKARGIIITMEALGISKDNIKAARSLKDLITGDNISKISKERQKASAVVTDGEVATAKTRSVSQLSFDQRLSNFQSLVDQAKGLGDYTLDEADEYSIKSLLSFIDELKSVDKAADDLEMPLTETRGKRNAFLYGENGAVEISKRVRKEVERKFGAGSSKYAQAGNLKFTRL